MYDFNKIEEKWQKYWEKNKSNFCDLNKSDKKSFYNLAMFYYPSGDSLHIGHGYNFTGSDVYGRFKRLQGYNVFQPMGSDSFGLPAENYAIKTGVHPKITTARNIESYEKQLKKLGIMYDWNKRIDTSSPEYYKYTQLIFSILYKLGLAYRKEAAVNWCSSCKTVLANEQVLIGLCERCDTAVEQKKLKQWFFKITQYSDLLIDDLEKIDWPEETKLLQKNWIGKSQGSKISFLTKNNSDKISVFTTRADTLFGATYLILAPEHQLIKKWQKTGLLFNQIEIEDYIKKSQNKAELKRIENKEKTGIEVKGIRAINPANQQEIPIFISDYVLAHYGTGAIMAVPAHDSRDFDFAKKFNLPISQVITNFKEEKSIDNTEKTLKEAFVNYGILINSSKFNGLTSEEAKKKITEFVKGKITTTYRLKDWLVSRQRYWGAPIPIVYCDNCGEVLDENLPVKLPDLKSYKPEDGQSPLARSKEFVNVSCPKCDKKARRATETLDTFVCSSWYFMKYLTPKSSPFQANAKMKKWLPVDQYCGGKEHACMHLLYARFVTKALKEAGYIEFDEPFLRLKHQGMILGEDGNKMSKSKGNVINPTKIINLFGTDTFRVYILFLAPFEQGGSWSDKGIGGADRFLKKVFLLKNKINFSSESLEKSVQLEALKHQTIKGVTKDIEKFHFNTAISKLMIFNNYLKEQKNISINDYLVLIILLAPFTPHLSEELFCFLKEKRGQKIKGSIFDEKWPKYDSELTKIEKIKIIIQINGKGREQQEIDRDLSEDEVKKIILNLSIIKSKIIGKKIKKIIYVKNRLINIVI